MSTPSRRSFWNRVAPWLIAAVILLWIVAECRGQVTTDVGATAEVWTSSERCFQNRLQASASVRGRWRWFGAEAHMGATWWGACDAKVAGSLLNAEAGRAIERRHGVEVWGQVRGFQVGGTVHRRAVHYIWRHTDRHPHFPGTWRIGRRGCSGQPTPSYPPGKGCPSIGYWDGVRLMIGYEGRGLDVSAYGPLWTWKESLTLPWPGWMADARYEMNSWTVEVSAEAGGNADWAADVGIRREVIGPIEIGVRVGQVASPIWKKDNLRRLTTTIMVN